MSKNITLEAANDVKSFNYCSQLINIHGFNCIRDLGDLTTAISHTSISAMLLKQFVDEATSLEELREKANNLKIEIDRLQNFVWDFEETEERIASEKWKQEQEKWEQQHPHITHNNEESESELADEIMDEESNESNTHVSD